jgi:hypothetical protein
MASNGMHSKDPPFNGKQSPNIKKEYENGEGNGLGVNVPQHPKIKMSLEMEEMESLGMLHKTQGLRMNMDMEEEMASLGMPQK